MPSHYGMGGLQQLDSQANPAPWGVVRRRVGFQKQALEALPTFSRMVDWIVDAYKRMGSPPPSPEKMANILKVMQERTSASPLDLSTRGILNPTRPAYEGQRFTRLKTPGDKIPHLREGKIAGEVPFEPRDPSKILRTDIDDPGHYARLEQSGERTPGNILVSRPPGVKELLTPDQAGLMTQFPSAMIHGMQSIPPALQAALKKSIDAFTKANNRAPDQKEMQKMISEISATPRSPLDLLSFPSTPIREPSAMADKLGRLSESMESGALDTLIKEAGKAAKLKGQDARDSFIRAIWKQQASGPKTGKELDYVTVLPTKTGQNLEQMTEALKRKDLAAEIRKYLAKKN